MKMASTLEMKMQRLNDARKKAEEISQKRQRLAGELDGHKKRQAELEKQCRDTYECEIAELPGLIQQLENECESALAEAESLLMVPATQVEKSVTPIPEKPTTPSKVQTTEPVQKPQGIVPPSVLRRIAKPVVEDEEDVV
jgi:uncharacterized protein (DUF3084 family)